MSRTADACSGESFPLRVRRTIGHAVGAIVGASGIGAYTALFFLSASGCYAYQPQISLNVPAQSTVRVDLTDVGRVSAATVLGPSVKELEGRVVASSDTLLSVGVMTVEHLDGTTDKWSGERLSLRRDDIARVDTKTLSRSRTAAALGIIAAGILAAGATAIYGSGSGGDGGAKGGGGNGNN